MQTYKVIYIYKIKATTSYEARKQVEQLVAEGKIDPDSLFATEDKPKSWFKSVTSQLSGGR